MQAHNNIKTEKQCEAVQEVVHYYLEPSVGYQLMTNMARMAIHVQQARTGSVLWLKELNKMLKPPEEYFFIHPATLACCINCSMGPLSNNSNSLNLVLGKMRSGGQCTPTAETQQIAVMD